MSRCTAPVEGHRTASAAARCPACRWGSSYRSPRRSYSSGSYGNGGYGNIPTSPRSATTTRSRPSWSPSGSSVSYTPNEVRALTPVRRQIEGQRVLLERYDVFLCHAWDDRKGTAKELHDLLQAAGVSVWFSEEQVVLGTPLLREIDKGLAKSRAGLVLVTPAFLSRVEAAGIADKELSALLARDLLVPVVHDTTYEELRNVSPLLGSRSGLSTAEDSMQDIATKIRELVTLDAA